MASAITSLEKLCTEKGFKMTAQRRVIVRVLAESDDHPAAEDVYRRASRIEQRISLATVYRTIRLLEEAGIVEKHDFGDGRARYEEIDRTHHDHLIDIDTGEVIEFVDDKIEALQEKIAAKLGYRLTGHRHELFGSRISKPEQD